MRGAFAGAPKKKLGLTVTSETARGLALAGAYLIYLVLLRVLCGWLLSRDEGDADLQLDGVDLAAKSRLRDSGVRRTGPLDAFETTRAIVTGRRVAREVLDRAP